MFTVLTGAAAVGVRKVDILGGNFSNVSLTNAIAGYRLLGTGPEQKTDDGTGTYQTINTWLLRGIGNDYQVRYDATGDIPIGSAINTWLTLASAKGWSFNLNSPGTLSCTGLVSIRQVSNLAVLDSANLTLTVEVTP